MAVTVPQLNKKRMQIEHACGHAVDYEMDDADLPEDATPETPCHFCQCADRVIPLQWVKQEDDWGCTIAAYAMILGRTYASVRDDFAVYIARKEGWRGVCSLFDGDQYLTSQGFAVARIFRYWRGEIREEWPPQPFGDIHLCDVIVSEGSSGSHSVVMLRDGSVLDPLMPEPRRLTDYHKVQHVALVVPF